jgi:hypothetical protein
MDLNQALHTCRCGGHIRCDGIMLPEWKITFIANPGQEKLPPEKRVGEFKYIEPKGELAHTVRFSDGMKASPLWRTVP